MTTQPFLTARAPAKVLLSGEHAAVYGHPALALAVDRYATTEIYSDRRLDVFLDLCDLRKTFRVTLSTLKTIRERLLLAYRRFMNGTLSIREVVRTPADCFHFALVSLLDACEIELTEGINVRLSSTIPIGCGMGSSAATIVSFVKALLHFFRIDRGLDWVERMINEVEQLHHGRPSGVDSFVSLHGGCLQFQKGQPPQKLHMPQGDLWIVNTGRPESTTGECVSAVKEKWEKSHIWDEFKAVTQTIKESMVGGNHAALAAGLRANQWLLERIGVVPKKVSSFIASLAQQGSVAKISGAGAIRGDAGGIVLVIPQEPIQSLCDMYGYSCFPLRGEANGAAVYYS